MDDITCNQNTYGIVTFNPHAKGYKYTHSISLSDGSMMIVKSAVSNYCTYTLEEFRQKGEWDISRRKMKERYLAKKAKQNST